jgi:hypothetical protein
MKTTRQLINETAGTYTKLLMFVTGSSDVEIDATLDRDELEHIHGVAKRVLHEGQELARKGEWLPGSDYQALNRLLREKPDER